jgi:hypothetical protein
MSNKCADCYRDIGSDLRFCLICQEERDRKLETYNNQLAEKLKIIEEHGLLKYNKTLEKMERIEKAKERNPEYWEKAKKK